MCTLNSLVKASRFILSLGTILGYLLLATTDTLLAKNSSSAHSEKATVNMFTTLVAPNSLTIIINSPNRCDTTINLPPAIINVMPGCNIVSITTSSPFLRLNSNGGSMNFHTGYYPIIYCVEDNCMNSFCDTMNLYVFDASLPNLTCLPETVININSDGQGSIPAYTLNGGSFDNCGHVYFKVKRMNKPIGYSCTSALNPNYQFDDEVEFCCRDISHSPIPVILRVYDIYPGDGVIPDTLFAPHYVECMVMITIGDKIGPTLRCPLNVTVNCGADLDSIYSAMPAVYSDNCYSVTLQTLITKKINGCGFGTVERKFIATDSSGLQSICTQIITINQNSIFNGLDPLQLKWPENKTVYACRIDVDTIDAGKPIIVEAECDNVQVSKTDDLYYFNRGGVCGKLLRFWQVINWCIYNPLLRPNPNIPENGYYSYYQEIKIIDTIPPAIFNVRDTTILSFAPDCGFTNVSLNSITAMDCGLINNLKYSYTVDYFSDGTIDRSGNGSNASGLFPMGVHVVKYTVEDSCHNHTIASAIIKVKDGKAPAALLLYGLGISLQEMNGRVMAMLPARILNSKSEDNCTKPEHLRFSFSNDINDTIRIYNCDDKGVQYLDIYVWDECMNFSITKSFVSVIDINNLCPTNIINHKIEGLIVSTKGYPIEEAQILMKDSIHYEIKKSDHNGSYSFEDIPQGMSFLLSLNSNAEPLLGVSTADIVKIQQHILGKISLSNAYEILSADVDLNGRITSNDISILRKLILGIIPAFPSQQSYLFIDKSYQFADWESPWVEYNKHSEMIIQNMDKSKNIDFIGIKLGDVNASLRTRGSKNYALNYRIANNQLIVEALFNEDILGMQIDLQSNIDDLFKSSESISIETNLEMQIDFHAYLKGLKLMLSSEKPINIRSGMQLFSIDLPFVKFNKEIELSLASNSEIVDKNIVSYPLIMHENSVMEIDGFDVMAYGPNPVQDYFEIFISTKEDVQLELEIADQTGKIIFRKENKISIRNEVIRIEKDEFKHQGVFIVRLKSKNRIWSQVVFIK
ncbi:MAG: T9SS type A sorting domain-containing protein [Saprospiraceae bacterium]